MWRLCQADGPYTVLANRGSQCETKQSEAQIELQDLQYTQFFTGVDPGFEVSDFHSNMNQSKGASDL